MAGDERYASRNAGQPAFVVIATKGQLVRLVSRVGTRSMTAIRDGRDDYHTARVVSLVYLDQPEGQRGVQLDRDLGGSRWWNEADLTEAAS